MGAWGRGSFENDDAADFVVELGGSGVDLLVDVVGEVADLSDVEYLQADAASRAVAAVEVVAACLDGAAGGLPDAARAWVQREPRAVPNHLARKAGRALERVLRDSELNDLWKDSPEHAAWVADVEALRARLPF